MFRNDTILFHFIGPMGVRVEVGQSLGLLCGFFLLMSGGDISWTITFVVLLLTAIFLHELGHAWGCVVQGVPVRRIMLHGGGGFCERSRSATRSEDELIVLMGPLVNLALWALSSLAWWAIWQDDVLAMGSVMIEVSQALFVFAHLNLFLFIFNMIPVQPLDGGKLLHLTMLRFLEPGAAHRVTGRIGLVLSILWLPAMAVVYYHYGWVLFFIPSIPAHYRMARGQLA